MLHLCFVHFTAADATQQLSCSHLFTSTEASAIICRTFQQMCVTRMSFLRDLIIVQVLYLRLGEKVRVDS